MRKYFADNESLRQNFPETDIIPVATAGTIGGLFRERVRRTPDAVAYREFNQQHGNWRDYTWAQMQHQVVRWQAALKSEALMPGDRVAMMLCNGPAWVILDQAAMGLGLVVVPLYIMDRPDSVAYILKDSGVKVLLLENRELWKQLEAIRDEWVGCGLQRIVVLSGIDAADRNDARLAVVEDWLPEADAQEMETIGKPDGLATIIYTSGTTGKPKGVMLSHLNILSNVHDSLRTLHMPRGSLFLSFLPLSHTFERTVGYYLAVMAGSTVAYARSIPLLAEDLQSIRPTVLVSVPRIYERIYAAIKAKLQEGTAYRRRLFDFTVAVGWSRFEYMQKRGPWRVAHLLWPLLNHLVAAKVAARLGGRLQTALSGGAALMPEISKVFIAMGVPILQGYGLTETSPVVCVNRIHDNVPASIGPTIPNVEVRIGENNALLVKGPNVMLGYWNNPEATRAMIAPDGWLNTGDTARIDESGKVYITGRLKDIIVMSNAEKIPPFDMEAAIARDSLFEQTMVIGEARPYLAVLAVLNEGQWKKAAAEAGIDPLAPAALQSEGAEQLVLTRISLQLRDFPGYAQVRRAALTLEPWSIENGLLTPTMKLRRLQVMEHHKKQIAKLYEGH
jgi:long-chain acyl-CoA synthetase